MHLHYCGCDVQIQSVVAVSDEDEAVIVPESTAWVSLYRPMELPPQHPNEAPTELAPSTPLAKEGEIHSIPETPKLAHDQGAYSLAEAAGGCATRIDGKDAITQTPPLLSRLLQGYLDHTGIEECPYHQMDHGVRDPNCDHCKRALGPLNHHKIVGNRHLPVFTFDFSGPHLRTQSEYGTVLARSSLEPRPYETALGIWRRESADISCLTLPSVLFLRTYVL